MNYSSGLVSPVLIHEIIVYKTLHIGLEMNKPIKSKVEHFKHHHEENQEAILKTLLVPSQPLFGSICNAMGCHLIHDSVVNLGRHL